MNRLLALVTLLVGCAVTPADDYLFPTGDTPARPTASRACRWTWRRRSQACSRKRSTIRVSPGRRSARSRSGSGTRPSSRRGPTRPSCSISAARHLRDPSLRDGAERRGRRARAPVLRTEPPVPGSHARSHEVPHDPQRARRRSGVRGLGARQPAALRQVDRCRRFVPRNAGGFLSRERPELVVGAWASSALVNDQLAFAGYDMLVSQSLGSTCTLLFQQVLSYASAQYDNAATRDSFSSSPSVRRRRRSRPTSNWFSGTIADAAQYGQSRKLRALHSSNIRHADHRVHGLPDPPLVMNVTPTSQGPVPPPGVSDHPVPRGSIISKLVRAEHERRLSWLEWFYQGL